MLIADDDCTQQSSSALVWQKEAVEQAILLNRHKEHG